MRSEVILNPCHLLTLKSIPEFDVNSNPKEKCSIEILDNTAPKRKTLTERYIGIVLAMGTSLAFCVINLLVKSLSSRYHVFNVGLWRYLSGLIPTIALSCYQHNSADKKSNIFASVWPLSQPGNRKTLFLILFRSAGTCTTVLVQFFALNYISLADLSVIGYCTPIGVTILAYFVLREAFSIIQIGASVVALIGVLIIARPPFLTGSDVFDMNHLLGIGVAFSAVGFRVTSMICLRYLRGSHYLLIQLAIGIWGVGQAFLMCLGVGRLELPEELTDWALGMAAGLVGFLGQIFLTLALKYETSGVIAMAQCMDVIFAFILQFIFFGMVPDPFSCIGAALVLASMGVVGFRKVITELPADSPTRVRLQFLLK